MDTRKQPWSQGDNHEHKVNHGHKVSKDVATIYTLLAFRAHIQCAQSVYCAIHIAEVKVIVEGKSI